MINNYLLILAIIVLFGAAKQALACNYDRISRLPVYDNIQESKKILNIPLNPKGKFYLYHSCGNLMRVARLPNGYEHDCEFVQHKLYIVDVYGRKIYKYSANGNFLQVIV